MTIDKDLLKYFHDFQFGNEFHAEEEDVLAVLSLPFNFSVDAGISKAVIIPYNRDYVIKVPFKGEFESGDFYKFEFADSCLPLKKRDNLWDYCAAEVELYNLAKEKGVEQFFPETKLLGYTKVEHYPIYVQEQGISFVKRGGDAKPALTDVEREEVRKKSNGRSEYVEIDERWLKEALDYYGAEEINKFLNFLDETGIGDLRDDNIGYDKDDKPIILDFSGFEG